MLRHTAFFFNRDTVTEEERLTQLKGFAYLRMECPMVRALDYGPDLFGGSRVLGELRPWKRTPRWRARLSGPPCHFDVGFCLDFDDQAGLDAYNKDDTHHIVGTYNQSVDRDELTARIDWWYDGGPLIRHGLVRHEEMFLWADDVTEHAKRAAFDAVRRLGEVPGVELVTIGENVGTLTTDFDWIVDLQVSDRDATARLVESDPYVAAMKLIAPATKYEWTARISYLSRGI